jgi:hypothetical protein
MAHTFKLLAPDMPFLPIQDPESMDEFMRRHVLGSSIPVRIQKTALGAQTAMGANPERHPHGEFVFVKKRPHGSAVYIR